MLLTKLQYRLLSELFLDIGKGLFLASFAIPVVHSFSTVVDLLATAFGAIMAVGFALILKSQEELYDTN